MCEPGPIVLLIVCCVWLLVVHCVQLFVMYCVRLSLTSHANLQSLKNEALSAVHCDRLPTALNAVGASFPAP